MAAFGCVVHDASPRRDEGPMWNDVDVLAKSYEPLRTSALRAARGYQAEIVVKE